MASRQGGDPLLSAVEAIHAAGLDGTLWPKALDRVATLVGGHAATLEIFDKRAWRHRAYHAHGIPPAAQIEYFNDYVSDSPRWRFMPEQTNGDICWDYQLIDEAGMDRDPFYAKLLGPLDMRYFLSGVILASANDYACFSIQRSIRQGHAEKAEIRLMKRLLPHVRQALDVAARLQTVERRGRSLEQAFDWITDGLAIVAADGTVAYANAAMAEIARTNDGPRLRGGRLEFVAAEARRGYDRALDAVRRLATGECPAPADLDFTVDRGPGAPPYVVSLRPLGADGAHGVLSAPGSTIVFVRDPERRGRASAAILRDRFGLTEAEASLALALHDGETLGGYAASHAVSMNTVYTHLRRVREKTDCHSTTHLVLKLDELRAPAAV